LCAETVIEIVEDVEDYGTFEAAVIADYDAQTAVEGEPVPEKLPEPGSAAADCQTK
jgi:hypothetical protein